MVFLCIAFSCFFSLIFVELLISVGLNQICEIFSFYFFKCFLPPVAFWDSNTYVMVLKVSQLTDAPFIILVFKISVFSLYSFVFKFINFLLPCLIHFLSHPMFNHLRHCIFSISEGWVWVFSISSMSVLSACSCPLSSWLLGWAILIMPILMSSSNNSILCHFWVCFCWLIFFLLLGYIFLLHCLLGNFWLVSRHCDILIGIQTLHIWVLHFFCIPLNIFKLHSGSKLSYLETIWSFKDWSFARCSQTTLLSRAKLAPLHRQ